MELDDKIKQQIEKAGLPQQGSYKFIPKIVANKRGQPTIEKKTIEHGPRKGKKGYVDAEGRIWIRNYAHAGYPNHWDVQIDGGHNYINVKDNGEMMTKTDRDFE